ncbi:uncharacterized protein I303_105318 [Kwoniella dejecticola CBS 10117]|uniref:Inositol-pentakisphosphate 2-kinase n=1 Tax=Kwoniella dejecticola CBS 10117 TaxID=1296121 RepID=A0AAJ8MHT6_9TREE
MVSILSFFQNKKKGKRPKSRSPSPTSNQSPTTASAKPSSPANANKPARFLSLRQKSTSSSNKPYDRSIRRGSSEISRKRSLGKSTTTPKPALASVFVPLDLGFDALKSDVDQLGIHGVGEKVVLQQDERDLIWHLELSMEEVRLGWEVIGRALRESDLTAPSLMLPFRVHLDSTAQLYIVTLFSLVIRPDLLNKLPSIAAQFAQPTSNPSAIWKDRLVSVLKDIDNTSELAEALKFILRRLRPTPLEPILDDGMYTKFVQAEIEASYPHEAFDTLLRPRLKAGVAGYLNEVFEVWSAIITHAEENGTSAGKLTSLLGWWAWRPDGKVDSWAELYEGWKLARQRVEHLLFVWIRYQTTKSQIPIRLQEVVEMYPFGASAAPSPQSPSIPPSSFPRRSCWVTLTTSEPVTGNLTPQAVFDIALSSKVTEGAAVPYWQTLVGRHRQGVSELFTKDSASLLRTANQSTFPVPLESRTQSPCSDKPDPRSLPLFQHRLSTPDESASRSRHHSHSGDLSTPPPSLSKSPTLPTLDSLSKDAKEGEPSTSLEKQASLGILPKTGGPAWDDFRKSGFSDSPTTVGDLNLTFSPESNSKSSSSAVQEVQSEKPKTAQRGFGQKRTTFDSPKIVNPAYSISREELTEIDDAFVAFVQDAQQDPPSTLTWPSFLLARLASPITLTDTDEAVELLLITVQYVAPSVLPSDRKVELAQLELERSASPSSSKAGTPKGFRSLTESFKRSTSFQSGMNLRKSFFGTSSFSLSRHTSNDLATLPEGEQRELRAPLSAQSLTPTEYTITEMGEMIKIPSPNEKGEEQPSEIHQLPDDAPAQITEQDIDVATIKGKPMVLGIESGPSVDSLASQWKYVGEGAEHIVFSHRGTLSIYNGKVLRLRKSQFLGNSPTDPEYRQTQTDWITTCLPKLVPPELLIHATEVILSEGWTKDLFAHADATRPEERKLLGDLKSLVAGQAKGVIMEDTTTNEKQDGLVNFAFEIKPKWGLLPDSSTIIPPEAAAIKSANCRFCMHRHYKGHDSSAEGKFCPLDLYSGDEGKMRKAIKGLWGIWTESEGQENNWRVFTNGERVNPNQLEVLERYLGKEAVVEKIADHIIPIVQASDVFGTLKTLQTNFDPTDISDLASRFSRAYPDEELFDASLIPSPTSSEMKEFIDLYLASPRAGKAGDKWTLRQRMIAFSLSAIFKDCSVFVKFTLQSSSPVDILTANSPREGWHFVEGSGKVKLIDLDLKPIQNLKKWKDTDDKIWKHWLQTQSTMLFTGEDEVGSRHSIIGETIKEEVSSEDNDKVDDPTSAVDQTIPTLSVDAPEGQDSDTASTRALFIPTPDRTLLPTPVPSPLPTSRFQDETPLYEVKESDDPQQESIASPDSAPEKEAVASMEGNADENEEEIIQARRTKRSLAPSPSPPPHIVDLPEGDAVSNVETSNKLPITTDEVEDLGHPAAPANKTIEKVMPEKPKQDVEEPHCGPGKSTPAAKEPTSEEAASAAEQEAVDESRFNAIQSESETIQDKIPESNDNLPNPCPQAPLKTETEMTEKNAERRVDGEEGILAVGMTGLGSVVGLAVDAVHTITDNLTSPVSNESDRKVKVETRSSTGQEDLQMTDSSTLSNQETENTDSISPSTAVVPESEPDTEVADRVVAHASVADQPETNSDSQAQAFDPTNPPSTIKHTSPEELIDVTPSSSSRPEAVKQLMTAQTEEESDIDSQVRGTESEQSPKSAPQQIAFENAHSAEAANLKAAGSDDRMNNEVIPQIETPQLESENFFTPAETPLIPQQPELEQPIFQLRPTLRSQLKEHRKQPRLSLPIRELTISKLRPRQISRQ